MDYHLLIFRDSTFQCTCHETYAAKDIDAAWDAHAAHMDGRGSE